MAKTGKAKQGPTRFPSFLSFFPLVNFGAGSTKLGLRFPPTNLAFSGSGRQNENPRNEVRGTREVRNRKAPQTRETQKFWVLLCLLPCCFVVEPRYRGSIVSTTTSPPLPTPGHHSSQNVIWLSVFSGSGHGWLREIRLDPRDEVRGNKQGERLETEIGCLLWDAYPCGYLGKYRGCMDGLVDGPPTCSK